MASTKKPVEVKLDRESIARVERKLKRLLGESRRQMPQLIKNIARKAANSAAKLTIPNKAHNTPMQGAGSSVRRPTLKDKFRPLVSTKEMGRGSFYLVNGPKSRPGRRKKRSGVNKRGFTGGGESRVLKSAGGELVIYTTKKISQKDQRFKRVNKLIKAWDKKKRSWKYIPTTVTGKYDKKNAAGRIPHYFTAKQAWLYSSARISRTLQRLNKNSNVAKKYGSMTDRLQRLDKPSLTLHNTSGYANKSGGNLVPKRALILAMRGLKKELQKRKIKIIQKARQQK